MDTITPQNGLDFEHDIRTYSNSARFRMRRDGKSREGKRGERGNFICHEDYMMFHRIFPSAVK